MGGSQTHGPVTYAQRPREKGITVLRDGPLITMRGSRKKTFTSDRARIVKKKKIGEDGRNR